MKSKKYTEIELKRDEIPNFVNENNEELKYLKDLSSINVFIGPNNIGKSRFLRSILKTPNIKHYCLGKEESLIYSRLQDIRNEIQTVIEQNDSVTSIKVHGSVFELNGTLLTLPNKFTSGPSDNSTLIEKYKNDYQILMSTGPYYQMGNKSPGRGNLAILQTQLQGLLERHRSVLAQIDKLIVKEGEFEKYYIPTLRGLNNFKRYIPDQEIDIYKKRIQDNYKIKETDSRVKIFTGLDLYERIKVMLLGELIQRKRVRDFETFLSKELYNNKEVTLIPRIDNDLEVLHVKIGNDPERPIYDLGDGIQSLIILTFPLFETEQGIFFIEEPEMHLHPGMQRKLLEALRARKNHQYFLTTHSNHFLDLTLDYEDITLFTVKKYDYEDSVEVKLISPGDETALQLLGAQNTSVFLANATIWVEGVTDRLYIRKYLEIYQEDKAEKIIEDIDYSFVEYGGDNITHWSFLDKEEYPINIERLCGKSVLISDKDGDKKIQRKEDLKNSLGNRYKLLSCREIENTLSFRVIGKVISFYENKNGNLSFSMPHFGSRTMFKKTGLGNFIHGSVFKNQEIKRPGGYKTESGTIKDKVTFCKKAISYINKNDMTEQSIDLAEFIYNFVLSEKKARVE